jgi:hypothetical protein
MGLDYRLVCRDCETDSETTEFSAVDHVSLKCAQWQEAFTIWARFLVEHSGHRIAVVDYLGNESVPWKVRGGYILGLDKTVPR